MLVPALNASLLVEANRFKVFSASPRAGYIRQLVLTIAVLLLGLVPPSFAGEDDRDDKKSLPVAAIQLISPVSLNQPVVLDGAGSLSPSGAKLAYAWRIAKAPAGSRAALDDASKIRPRFTPDVAGDYTLELVTRAGSVASAAQQFVISTLNQAPVAMIVASRHPVTGVYTFNASRSADNEGDALSCGWTLTAKPRGSASTIANPTSPLASLAPDVAGAYAVALTITDARGKATVAAPVTITSGQSIMTANAGPDRRGQLGQVVWLDPFASTNAPQPAGSLLSASWALIAAPATSKTALGQEVLGRTPFTPDVVGDYVAQLTLTDGTQIATDTMVVSVGTAASVPPVANAGHYPQAAIGARVDLSATTSTDLDGDLLTYAWSILSRPAGSTATLANAASPRASFTPDVAGLYIAQLQVRDQTGLASYATALISTNTPAPVADAGPDKLADANRQATVTAAGSTGAGLAYQWSLLGYARLPGGGGTDDDHGGDDGRIGSGGDDHTGGDSQCYDGDRYDDRGLWHSRDESTSGTSGATTTPANGSAALPKATLGTPTAVSTLVTLDSATIPLSQAVLLAPVAQPFSGQDAGVNGSGLRLSPLGVIAAAPGGARTIWQIRNASTRCRTVTLAAVGNSYAVRFTLPAKTELYVASPFATGTATHKLFDGWQLIDTKAAGTVAYADSRPISTGATATAFAVLQVVVANAAGSSADTVLVTTGNVAPVAAITGPATAITGASVTLDGTPSSDANGTALTYKWSLLYRPAGSKTLLTGSTTATPALIPDARGLYIAQLVVSDGMLDSAPVTFVLSVPNRPPVITSNPVTTAILNAGYSYSLAATDPDNDPVTFTLVSGPTGATLAGSTLGWTPTAAGSYPVTVRASDGQGGITDQAFTITVAPAAGNQPPVLAAIGDKTVALGSTLAFVVAATDPNGDAITYGANPLPGANVTTPAGGATFDAKTGAFSFRPTSATPATYRVTFTASDSKASSQQTITITVLPGNPAALANLAGRVLDATDYANGITTPIAGATLTLGSATATSSATGTFSLSGLTTGAASLAATKSGYAQATRTLTLYGGLTTSVDPDVLLVRVTGTGVAVSPTTPTSINNPAIPGVAVNVPTGSAKNPDGTPYTGTLTLTDVPPKAAGLPDTIKSCSVQTLAASTPVSFSPAAAITLPNRDALPANTKVEIWALDPARGTYVRVALGQVSTDGASIATALGGLSSATSFVATPIAPESTASSIEPKDRWVPSVLGEGNLKAIAVMPGHQSVGQTRAASLVYNSATADPRPVLSSIVNIDVRRGLPNALETQLFVNGVKIPDILVTNVAASANPKDTGLTGAAEKLSRQITFDASFLSTGAYPYRILTFAKYGCTSIASVETGRVFVNNRATSDVGRGWKNNDLQSVTIAPDGAAVLEEPDGSLTRFAPKKAVTAFDRAPFRFAPVGGNYVVTSDFDGDGKPDFAFTDEGAGKIVVYLNQGNGNFTRRTDIAYLPSGNPPPPEGTTYTPAAQSLLAGDINGDGIPDLVITNQAAAGATPGVFVALGLGDGGFGPLTQIAGTENKSYASAEIADLDGDGNLDLVVTEGIFNGPVIFWGNGDGTFTRGTQPFDGNVLRLIVRDLNGDGKPDLLYASGPFVYAQINKGNRTFQQLADNKVEYSTLGLLNQIVDVKGPNRQGQTDLVFANNNNVVTVAYYDPAKGSFGSIGLRQSTAVPNGSGYISSVRFADLDGTGYPNILLGLQNAGVASAAVMKGNPDGSFAAPTPLALGHGIDANRVLDMDGDGGLDLVSLNRFDGTVELSSIVDGKYVSPLPDFTTFERQADGSYIRRYKDGSTVTFNAQGLQTAVTDPNGNTTAYVYDSAAHLTAQTDPAGLATTYAYSGGKLASVTDPAGKVTAFALNNGLLQVVTRADATKLSYAYDASGRLTGETDPLGASTTNAYNAAGQLTQSTFPDGASVKLAVAKSIGIADLSGPAPVPQNYVRPEDRVTTLTDPRGKITTIQVNEYGAVLRTLDPIGRLTSYTRTASNLVSRIDAPSSVAAPSPGTGGSTVPLTLGPGLTRSTVRFLETRLGLVIKTGVTDPLAPVVPTGTVGTTVAYDALGNVTEIKKAVGSPIETRTTYEYEPVHNRVAKKTEWSYNPFSGPLSITSYTYDANGNMLTSTEFDNVFAASGSTKTYTYDARGLKLTEADENGNSTSYTYDATTGNMLSMTNANGVTSRYALDASGNALSMTEASGTGVQRSMSATYDPLNRQLTYTDGEGNTTSYKYDFYGNVTTVTDPTGIVSSRTYDVRHRPFSETNPASGTTNYAYDGSGNLISVTDPTGVVSTTDYDDANRVTRMVDGKGGVRLKTYDASDNVTTDGDALGNTTSYAYDLLNRLTTRTDASGKVWAFEHDARDLPSRTTKPSGKVFDYSYDARKRPTIIASGGRFVRSFQYDAASNVQALVDNNTNEIDYTYDRLNRVSQAIIPGGRLTYGYDELNRRASVTDETGATHRYAFDRNDRLAAVTAPSGKTVTHQYDAGDRPVRYFWPNGLRTQLAYDTGAASGKTGRALSVARGLDQAGAGGSALNQLLGTFSYGYEARGNIASIAEPSRTRNYTYDALERLTKVEEPRPAPAAPVTTESYTLDAEGNRIASQLSAFHVTAPANRLIEDANAAYEYDPDGNMVTKTIKASGKQWRYSHDIFDRLITAELYASAGASAYDTRVEYTYDGLDNRITRRELGPGGAAIKDTSFRNDIVDADSIIETTYAATGTTQKRTWFTLGETDELYTVTPNASGNANQVGTSSLYASIDHLGSVRALADDAGQVVASYDYDSYGNPQATVDNVAPQPYRYTGRLYDATTGLYNYRAREYDAALGRFLQEDPIWFQSGDSNIYRYVGSNSIKYRDPSGKSPAIEYACELVHSYGNAITVGGNGGLIAVGLYGTVGSLLLNTFNQPDAAQQLELEAARAAQYLDAVILGTAGAKLLCGQVSKAAVCPYTPGKNSFDGDTMVWIKENLIGEPSRKKISDLAVGDAVASWNPATNGFDYKAITGKSSRLADQTYKLTMRTADGAVDTIRTTFNHPFLRADSGNSDVFAPMEPAGAWTAAGKLRAGDRVRSATGAPLTVVGAEVDLSPARVYSLEVADLHSFAVGEHGAWGHNAGYLTEDMELTVQEFVSKYCKASVKNARSFDGGSLNIKIKDLPGDSKLHKLLKQDRFRK